MVASAVPAELRRATAARVVSVVVAATVATVVRVLTPWWLVLQAATGATRVLAARAETAARAVRQL